MSDHTPTPDYSRNAFSLYQYNYNTSIFHPSFQNPQRERPDILHASNNNIQIRYNSYYSSLPGAEGAQMQIENGLRSGNFDSNSPSLQSVTGLNENCNEYPPDQYQGNYLSNHHLSQVPSSPTQAACSTLKGARRKSFLTEKLKSFECSACNRFFTSSPHLNRHYGTNVHRKNVMFRGQPYPSPPSLSKNVYPNRESSTRVDRSRKRAIDSLEGVESSPISEILQPQNGPYQRQLVPDMQQPPVLYSHIVHGTSVGEVMINLEKPKPPYDRTPLNGKAGPTTDNSNSRDLIPPIANKNPRFEIASANMTMEQFQLNSNTSAPQGTQDMPINSLNTTGVHQFINTTQSLTRCETINTYRNSFLTNNADANVENSASQNCQDNDDISEIDVPRIMQECIEKLGEIAYLLPLNGSANENDKSNHSVVKK